LLIPFTIHTFVLFTFTFTLEQYIHICPLVVDILLLLLPFHSFAVVCCCRLVTFAVTAHHHVGLGWSYSLRTFTSYAVTANFCLAVLRHAARVRLVVTRSYTLCLVGCLPHGYVVTTFVTTLRSAPSGCYTLPGYLAVTFAVTHIAGYLARTFTGCATVWTPPCGLIRFWMRLRFLTLLQVGLS